MSESPADPGSDPILDMPGDVAASCLSFVDVRTLLGVAQHVNRAWRRAINGGLLAVWRDLVLKGHAQDPWNSDAQLADVVRSSQDAVLSLTANNCLTNEGVNLIRTLSNLRVLEIGIQTCIDEQCSISPELPFLPLLEEVTIRDSNGVTFPPLQFLKTVRCHSCKTVTGLHNLPALIELQLSGCAVDADDEWPSGLQTLAIDRCHKVCPTIIGCIATLRQLARLDTDWSFVHQNQHVFFTPPYNQLSFLGDFTSLQHYSVTVPVPTPAFPAFPLQAVLSYMGAMTSLVELELAGMQATDQDLQCLAQLTNLQRITLCQNYTLTVQGLRHVTSLPNLTSLCVKYCYIGDFSPIALCKQLRELRVIQSYPHGQCPVHTKAITQLQHLEKLELSGWLEDPHVLLYFCTMRTLRELVVQQTWPPFPASSFTSLPALCMLERITVVPIADIKQLEDCLVQMPSLKNIQLQVNHSDEDHQQHGHYHHHHHQALNERRLRKALPRLEAIDLRC